MISVVIPLYNKEEYIERAINSVLLQSFQEFEIVVVNDGSTDKSEEIVRNLRNPKIHLINQENKGVSAARNRGVEESSFEYIAFLDADDEWTENHLSDIKELIEKYPDCGVFATSYYYEENNEFFTPRVFGNYSFDSDSGVLDNYYELASGADFPIHQSSYVVKKKKCEEIGGFPVGVASGEDIITLARLYTVCDFAYCKRPSSVYHLVYEGKNYRPLLRVNPLDNAFDSLLTIVPHKKGIRRFVSSWHKRRMVNALLGHDYILTMREFFKSFSIYPFQTKLYTSLLVSIVSLLTKKSILSLNKHISQNKHT